jgi:hypothetical protein
LPARALEGREQIFALGAKDLVVVLELRDRPAQLLPVSFECQLRLPTF